MKPICLFLLLSISCSLFAQPVNNRTSTFLDISGVNAKIYSDGNLFQDLANGNAAYEVPKGNNTFSINASTFWMSSFDSVGNLPRYAIAYDRFGTDNHFRTGPIDVINQVRDSTPQFQRLWKVNKTVVDRHIQDWNTSGYSVPAEIADWPGNGNANTAQQLAPFKDLDNDGIYEPQNGEYPEILGDQAVYLIANTLIGDGQSDTVFNLVWDSTTMTPRYTTPNSLRSSMRIEFHTMLYSYIHSNPEIANTVFVNVKLFNRSNTTEHDYSDFKFSVFTDFSLGFRGDNYIGTHTTKNMYFAYNGDNFDESFGGRLGYGRNNAAQGIKFLDRTIDHSSYYYTTGVQGWIDMPIHYFNYQRNLWPWGNPINYGGDGLFSACVDTSKRARFIYDGNPVDTTGAAWTEITPCLGVVNQQPHVSGERIMFGGPALPKQFNHGTSIEFNYAYIFAQDSTGNSPAAGVTALKAAADTIQEFYENVVTALNEPTTEKLQFGIYPNPTNNLIHLKLREQQFNIQLLNLDGSLIKEVNNQSTIDVSDLSSGVYFVRVQSAKNVGTKKLIVVE